MFTNQIMDDVPVPVSPASERFLDQIRLFMRSRNMAWATEKTYVSWIRRYILFHDKRHPKDMGAAEIETYLAYLANQRGVSPGTQAVALNALVFLYKRFMQREVGQLQYPAARGTGQAACAGSVQPCRGDGGYRAFRWSVLADEHADVRCRTPGDGMLLPARQRH